MVETERVNNLHKEIRSMNRWILPAGAGVATVFLLGGLPLIPLLAGAGVAAVVSAATNRTAG